MAKKSAKGDAPKEAKAPKADKGKDEAAAKKPRKRKAEAGAWALQAPRPGLALHYLARYVVYIHININIYIFIFIALSLSLSLSLSLKPLGGPCVRTICSS